LPDELRDISEACERLALLDNVGIVLDVRIGIFP